MKRIIIPGAILAAVALAGCVTEAVPAGAPGIPYELMEGDFIP